MKTGALLRQARRAAGLSQPELAKRARTSQPAVAAYESDARVPTLGTLERLLDACDYDLDVLARPRMRRNAASLRDLSEQVRSDLAADLERDATRMLFGFSDDFRGSPRPGKIALIKDEPLPTGALRFDAAFAGLAEFFAAEAQVPVPEWVDGPGRFAEPWWFVTSKPAFHAYVLARTPASLARHGVFIAREAFDRV